MSRTDELSFVKGLFLGVIQADKVVPYPTPDLEVSESIQMITDTLHDWAASAIDGKAIDKAGRLPESVIQGIKELGVLGILTPERYGGAELPVIAYCRMLEAASEHDASTSTFIGGHVSLCTKAVHLFGTEEQKQKYLPKLATGELIGAFSLSEPGAGSDAAGLSTFARHDPEHHRFLISGTKMWVTNGGLADLVILFAKTEEAEGKRKVTAFLVEKDFPGFQVGEEEDKMGLKGSSTVELVLENCEVPESAVLGERGRGFRVAMEVLNGGRLTLAAGCVGSAKRMVREAVAFTTARKQFDTPIWEFEMLRAKLTDMMVRTFAMESIVTLTAGMVDRGDADYQLEAAICKTFNTESLWTIINHAVQMAGGSGFVSDYPFERFLRDARVNMIFEGTNEIQRLFIALQGLKAPGAYLKEVGAGGIGRLTAYAVKRLKRATAGPAFELDCPVVKEEVGRVEEYTAELANGVERVLKTHGAEIREREYLQERLADTVIGLYTLTACIVRTAAKVAAEGEEQAGREIDLTRAWGNQAWRRMRRNLAMLESNDDARTSRIAAATVNAGGYNL